MNSNSNETPEGSEQPTAGIDTSSQPAYPGPPESKEHPWLLVLKVAGCILPGCLLLLVIGYMLMGIIVMALAGWSESRQTIPTTSPAPGGSSQTRQPGMAATASWADCPGNGELLRCGRLAGVLKAAGYREAARQLRPTRAAPPRCCKPSADAGDPS